MQVSIEMMKAAREADDELWLRYQVAIEPDEQQYMPYARWLALMVRQLEEKQCDGSRS